MRTNIPSNKPSKSRVSAQGREAVSENKEKQKIENEFLAAVLDAAAFDPVRSLGSAASGIVAMLVVREWIRAGVSADLASKTITEIVARRRAAGQAPPRSLKYYLAPVSEAYVRANPEQIAQDRADNQWRGRVKVWMKSGQWLAQWGDVPDSRGTNVPICVLKEFEVCQ